MSSLVESFDRSSTDAITKTDEKTSIDSGECSPDGRFSQTERLGVGLLVEGRGFQVEGTNFSCFSFYPSYKKYIK